MTLKDLITEIEQAIPKEYWVRFTMHYTRGVLGNEIEWQCTVGRKRGFGNVGHVTAFSIKSLKAQIAEHILPRITGVKPVDLDELDCEIPAGTEGEI